jgi:ssDNA-binding Zn-finger/Zn-ribbon topoisomerase 1
MGCSGYPKCKNTGDVPAKLMDEMGLNGNGNGASANRNGNAGDGPTPLPPPMEHEDAA